MDKIKLALVSKTAWTIVAIFVFNGLTAVHDMLPQASITAVDLILSFLAIYFRVNPTAENKV